MSVLPVPRNWNKRVKVAILHALSLARSSFTGAVAQLSMSRRRTHRLVAEIERLKSELRLHREELRLKDARMGRVPPRRRPHYSPTERMSILELRALRGWSVAQTAAVFLVSRATVSSWTSRLRRGDDVNLLKMQTPVNRFPDFVRYVIQRLKTLCPHLGKVKIAQVLCRAGLHLAATTVGRILREPPVGEPDAGKSQTLIVADGPDQVWNLDLTTIPVGGGFWTSYFPFSVPPCWPFCWWIAVVFDQFSRRVLDFELFRQHPNAADICTFMDRITGRIRRTPKTLISDGEGQFVSDRLKGWCRDHDVEPRVDTWDRQGVLRSSIASSRP